MHKAVTIVAATLLLEVVEGCSPRTPLPKEPPMEHRTSERTTFAADTAFLRANGEVVVLASPGGGRVAVSPKYQGRVMTSAVADDGDSLGWIHRAFIAAGKTGTPFDNYGGEDRFWLGPEGGQFALYFPPGAPFSFDAWQTPAAFQEGAWDVTHRTETAIGLAHRMSVKNYGGATFDVEVTREIAALGRAAVVERLGVALDDRVRWVAFESTNAIRNAGTSAWTEDKGLVSIWILGMFAPAPDAKVVVPFAKDGGGPIVNDAYFGKVPPDRLAIDEAKGTLVFTCDGKHRSKIGLGPRRALPVAGSYSASARLLTIVQYDKPAAATRYVNSMWETQKEPYGGDVVNSYNDGPPAPGKPSLGGFYELETSSPAAALVPGKTLVHAHRTFHFVGDPAVLEPIAQKVLGVSLATLK